MFNDYVTQLYRNFLGREPDEAGLAYWNSQLQSGSLDAISLTKTLLQSVEHQTIFKPIALIYYAALDRMPDEAGLVYWANEMRKGASIGTIAASIAASEEFEALHGQSSNEQFLIDLYDSALERAPDTAGLNFWKSVLEMGFDRATVMQFIATSPEMIQTRSEEIDYVLLYRGIFGELPTQEMIDAAVPIKDINALIETLYESSGYTGAKVPGLDMYVDPTPEPEPEPDPKPEPDTDPGPPPDTIPPSILLFTVSSLTQLEVTSTETGSAGLYNEIGNVPITSTTISANIRTDLTVSAQATLTTARLQVFDSSGNSTFSPTLVKLGTSGDDTITSSAAGDYIFGFSGNNSLIGGIGHDIIIGGGGDDTILGGDGDDAIASGGGNDSLTGGLGNDTFFMTSGTSKITDLGGSDVFIISIGASLADATISSNYLATDASENLSGSYNARFAMASSATEANFSAMTVRSEENGGVRINAHASTASTITGSSGSDVITGSSAADSLDGGAGSDNIMGGDGNDTITGGAGADQINAGAGNNVIYDAGVDADVITHNSASSKVGIDVTGTGAVTLTASQAGAMTFSEANINTTVNASTSTAAVTLMGDSGADNLTGGAGKDTISGYAGADVMTGGAGADVLDGGLGVNTYSAAGTNGVTDIGSVGASVGQVINLSANTLTAVDVMNAMGNNYATASAYKDVLSNTASYLFALVDRHFLNSTDTDTLTSFQNATGSAGVDYIVGSVSNNVITGGEGVDVITGGAGADVLKGGLGDDDFVYTALAQGGNVATAGATTFTAGDTITDFVSGTDDLNFAATATGANVVTSAGASINLATSGVVIVNTSFDVTGATSFANLLAALNTAAGNAYTAHLISTTYFAIFDNNESAAHHYNIFELTILHTLAGVMLDAENSTASLIATLTAPVLVAGDFILGIPDG